MSDRAIHEREKQVEDLRARQKKSLEVRDFVISERKIVLELLEKTVEGRDRERISNLRLRVQEKDRQLQLVEDELKEIESQLAEAERRLLETRQRQ